MGLAVTWGSVGFERRGLLAFAIGAVTAASAALVGAGSGGAISALADPGPGVSRTGSAVARAVVLASGGEASGVRRIAAHPAAEPTRPSPIAAASQARRCREGGAWGGVVSKGSFVAGGRAGRAPTLGIEPLIVPTEAWAPRGSRAVAVVSCESGESWKDEGATTTERSSDRKGCSASASSIADA